MRAVLAVLAAHLDDPGRFDDPWGQRSYRSQDLILAAFVRVAGAERFALAALGAARAERIGYELAEFDDKSRASLRPQCQAFDRSALN